MYPRCRLLQGHSLKRKNTKKEIDGGDLIVRWRLIVWLSG
jgi:hypothetical protein